MRRARVTGTFIQKKLSKRKEVLPQRCLLETKSVVQVLGSIVSLEGKMKNSGN